MSQSPYTSDSMTQIITAMQEAFSSSQSNGGEIAENLIAALDAADPQVESLAGMFPEGYAAIKADAMEIFYTALNNGLSVENAFDVALDTFVSSLSGRGNETGDFKAVGENADAMANSDHPGMPEYSPADWGQKAVMNDNPGNDEPTFFDFNDGGWIRKTVENGKPDDTELTFFDFESGGQARNETGDGNTHDNGLPGVDVDSWGRFGGGFSGGNFGVDFGGGRFGGGNFDPFGGAFGGGSPGGGGDPDPPKATVAITALGAEKAEGDNGTTSYTFTVTRSGDTSTSHSVDYAVTGVNTADSAGADANDFINGQLPSGTVSFAPGETSQTITIQVSGDTAVETDEIFSVTLSNPSEGITIVTESADTLILNDDAEVIPPDPSPASFSIAALDAERAEPDIGTRDFTFTVTRSGNTEGTHTIDYTVNGSGANPADADDFSGSVLPEGTITFAPGETEQAITIKVAGDEDVEPDENFTVSLSDPSGEAIIINASAEGTITNDDTTPPPLPPKFSGLSIAGKNADMAEGDAGTTAHTFTVNRAGDISQAVSVKWTVRGSGGDPADAADFGGTLPSGTLNFGAGVFSQTITVDVTGDLDVEADETFSVVLSNPIGNVQILKSSTTGTIQNNDIDLSIAATDANKAEGDAATTAYTFTVTRVGDTSGPTSVDWGVTGSSGNPADAADFGGVLPSGTVNFAAGDITQVITVNVAGELDVELDEGFSVTLSNPSGNAEIVTATAMGTIQNDDIDLSIAATDAVKVEGDAGTTAYTFTVTRVGDTSGPTSVDWDVTGSGGNPADATDFGGVLPSGTVNFAAGDTTQVITVNVNGELDVEPDEGFTVTLSNPSGNAEIVTATAAGTIQNDDIDLSIAATDAVKAEGDAGTTAFTFTVTRSGDTSGTTDVDWAVTGSSGDPADATDFGGTLPSGTVSFGVGVTAQVVTVNVTGDMDVENDEGFTVTLSNPSGNAQIVTPTANGTIQNDDTSVSIAATDTNKDEGDSGNTPHVFTVTRNGVTTGTSAVDWSVAGTGANPADTVDFGSAFPTGTVSFAAGVTTQTITVPVVGDNCPENDEGFVVMLSNPPAGVSITGSTATGSILDDDSVPIVQSVTSATAATMSITGDGGADTLSVNLADPGFTGYNINVNGWGGADAIAVSLSATTASINSNNITINGGAGPACGGPDGDNTISLNMNANGALSNNTVNLFGSNGSDVISAAISGATINSNVIAMSGSDADDTIIFQAHANSSMFNNTITMTGGTGSDMLNFTASSTGSVSKNIIALSGNAQNDALNLLLSSVSAFKTNTVNMAGGTGSDTLSFTATGLSSFISNSISMTGGTGSDRLNFTAANAGSVSSNIIALSGNAQNDALNLLLSSVSAFKTNTVNMAGGAGSDTLSFTATGLSSFISNSISMTGGTGSDRLNFTAANAGSVSNNIIALSGNAQNDALNLQLGSIAAFKTNTVNMAGGAGSDTLSLTATGLSSFISNTITMTGGSGNDFVSFTAANAGSVNNNKIAVSGNTGSDSLNLQLSSIAAFKTNTVNMAGGAGNDTLSLTATILSSFLNNTITMTGSTGNDMVRFKAAGPGPLNSNIIALSGNTGNDYLNLQLSSIAAFKTNTVNMAGGAGNDTLSFTATGPSSFINNTVTMTGGSGSDFVSFTAANAGSVSNNIIALSGNAQNDYLNLQLNSIAAFKTNTVNMAGGAGTDTLSLTATGLSSFSSNTITMTGGSGSDGIFFKANLSFDFESNTINMIGNSATDLIRFTISADDFSFNTITMTGGSGNDTISFLANLNTMAANSVDLIGGSGSDVLNLSITANSINSNMFDIMGGSGNDTIAALVSAGTGSFFNNNTFSVSAGTGSDNVFLQFYMPTISGIGYNMSGGTGDDTLQFYASVSNNLTGNNILLNGGTGNDNLAMTLDYSGTWASFNELHLLGGAGSDSLTISLSGSNFSNNTLSMAGDMGDDFMIFNGALSSTFSNNMVTMIGGQGNDIMSVSFTTTLIGGNNAFNLMGNTGSDQFSINDSNTALATYNFWYFDTGDLGDTVNGLSASHNFGFYFQNTAGQFNGVTSFGHLATANFALNAPGDADDYFIYDPTLQVLWYDADGNGAGAAMTVATFDADVSISASEIFLTGFSSNVFLTGDALNNTLSFSTVTSTFIGHRIFALGMEGSDTVSISLSATSSTISNNFIRLTGGSETVSDGADNMFLGMWADYISSNYIMMNGGGGSDVLSISATGTSFNNNTVNMNGGSGNDAMRFWVSATDSVNSNVVRMFGGAGSDTMQLTVSMTSSSLISNYFLMSGSSGNDLMTMQFIPTTTTVGIYAISSNTFVMRGGAGSDVMAFRASSITETFQDNRVTMSGGAGNDLINFSVTVTDAYDYYDNTINLYGGAGSDSISVNVGYLTGTSYFNDNVFLISGGTGNDTLQANFTVEFSTSTTAYVSGLDITMLGGEGDDTLSLTMDFDLIATWGESVYFTDNYILMSGGAGNDMLALNMAVSMSNTSSYYCTFSQNTFSMVGGAGNDTLSFDFDLTMYAYSSSVYFNDNYFLLSGGSGDDMLTLDMSISMSVSSYYYCTFSQNTFSMVGGAGNDTLSFDFDLTMYAYSSSVYFNDNYFLFSGSAGNDNLTLNMAVSMSNSYSYMYFTDNTVSMLGGAGSDNLSLVMDVDIYVLSDTNYFTSNNFLLSGGTGNDTLFISLDVQMSATDSNYFYGNIFEMEGGSGNDFLTFNMNVTMTTTDWCRFSWNTFSLGGGAGSDFLSLTGFLNVSSYIDDNDFYLSGGDSNDTLFLSLTFSGGATVSDNTFYLAGGTGSDFLTAIFNGISNVFSSNSITLIGGSGSDALRVSFSTSFSGSTGNRVLIQGDTGNDTITITADTSDASFVFRYMATGDAGDSINGLTSGHAYQFQFENAQFIGDGATLLAGPLAVTNFATGAGAADGNDFFIYNPTTPALLYDADGTGGVAAVTVATFNVDVGMTAGHITLI